MPATTTITLDILLAEQKRIRGHMVRSYPDLVRAGKLSPYERDHRLNCNSKLIELIIQAMRNKQTKGPKLVKLFEDVIV